MKIAPVSTEREKSVRPLLPGTGPAGASHKRGQTLISRTLISRTRVSLSRRRGLAALASALLLPWPRRPGTPSGRELWAQESLDTLFVPDDTDRAVGDAVDYLVRSQRDDGSIHDRGHPIAMTSLAIMAMASVGTLPGEATPTGRALAKALDFVLGERNQDAQGYFGNQDGSRMYGHGITTLMLTELLGMGQTVEQNRRIHAALENALRLILAAQAVPKQPQYAGGWRYTPSSKDSDLSVSVWQLMALRSAKNDGLEIPGEAIEEALGYLRNSYTSPLDRQGNPREAVAGFSYTPGTRTPSFTMTSAGLLAMQVCGEYDSPLVKGSADWLMRHPPRRHERFFFYGIYYYAQGMHQVGGRHAAEASRVVPSLLMDEQRSDGSWSGRSSDEQRYGTVYATALAVLSLSVRYHYLPIYQR